MPNYDYNQSLLAQALADEVLCIGQKWVWIKGKLTTRVVEVLKRDGAYVHIRTIPEGRYRNRSSRIWLPRFFAEYSHEGKLYG